LNHYDAILFDFDGVLVDSEPVHHQCWQEILREFGIELTWETFRDHCIGLADRLMLQRLAAQVTPSLDVEALYATYPRKKARFRQLMEEQMPFFVGARELFASLDGYALAVVTSSGRGEVEPILEKAGLARFLRTAVYAGDVKRLKPAPDPYLLAAERVGALRPLVIEDSDAGEQSGRAAGFDVLRVSCSAEVPDAVCQKLGLVHAVFRNEHRP
jgi:beta-phosphoglucomutase